MLVLLAAQHVLDQGGRVAILDYDYPPTRTWTDRALSLGGQRFLDALCDWGRFQHFPGHAVQPKHRAAIADWLTDSDLNMVAIDTAGAAGCPIDGANPDPWINEHLGTFRQAGCGVVVTDHLPKSATLRAEQRGAVGSGQKWARADVSLRLGGQCWTRSEEGTMFIEHDKDKLGLWSVPVGQTFATIRGTWRDGALGITIRPAETQSGTRPNVQDLEDRILVVLEDGETTASELQSEVKGRRADFIAARNNLETAGTIRQCREGQKRLWSIT